MLHAGALDKRITIQQRAGTQDSQFGTDTGGWTTVTTVWASKEDLRPSKNEALVQGLETARNPTRFVIRWLPDIDSSMRIVCEGISYAIVGGPAELGRRDGLEFMCEKVTLV